MLKIYVFMHNRDDTKSDSNKIAFYITVSTRHSLYCISIQSPKEKSLLWIWSYQCFQNQTASELSLLKEGQERTQACLLHLTFYGYNIHWIWMYKVKKKSLFERPESVYQVPGYCYTGRTSFLKSNKENFPTYSS